MPKADAYKLRVKTLENRLKKSTAKTDRAVLTRKLTALRAMVENEDWLDGKSAK